MRGAGGIKMIGLAISPQPGANHIAIVDELKIRLEQIKKDLPEDITLGIMNDTTLTIRNAITEVEETILMLPPRAAISASFALTSLSII